MQIKLSLVGYFAQDLGEKLEPTLRYIEKVRHHAAAMRLNGYPLHELVHVGIEHTRWQCGSDVRVVFDNMTVEPFDRNGEYL